MTVGIVSVATNTEKVKKDNYFNLTAQAVFFLCSF